MESFNPLGVWWYKRHRKEVFRGILSDNYVKNGDRAFPAIFYEILHNMLFNFLAKPDFIAYNCRHYKDTARLICTAGDEILGNAQIDFSPMEKTRHRAVVSLCVRQSCWGLGVGTALFTALMELARQRGVEIVELAFVEGNDRARKLYEKFGFAIVCEKPRAYKLRDGSYRKEITMQCRL